MTALQVGYGASGSSRRRAVTFICLMLSASLATAITVYVDSYSVHKWEELLSIGPVAMEVGGVGVQDIQDEISQIPGVLKTATFVIAHGALSPVSWSQYEGSFGGGIIEYNHALVDAFSELFILESGSFPEEVDEIVLSVEVADNIDVGIGDLVNYTQEVHGDTGSYIMKVVGLWNPQGSNVDYSNYGWSIAIVMPPMIGLTSADVYVWVDVDRSHISPFNVQASLDYLTRIEESIRQLDPTYNPQYGGGRYWISDGLFYGITRYAMWQQYKRMTQLLRAGGAIILVILTLFLAVRHNMNERRYESNILISRGADKNTVYNMVYKEIMVIAVLSTIVGLGLGTVLSRVGIISTDYFALDWPRFFSEPLLISLESLIMSALIGAFVPVGAIVAYDIVYKTKRAADESTGKLAKLTRGLVFIKWDVLLVSLTGAAIIAMLSLGSSMQLNLFLRFFSNIILSFAPFALFLGAASLFIKALRAGASKVSSRLKGVFGVIPSSVGIRRIGKAASSAGPVAMVFVLTISLAWSNAVVSDSLPLTKTNQAKFAFGADIRFDLDSLQSFASVNRTGFIENCTQHGAYVAGAELSIAELMLSTGQYDSADLVAMNPADFLDVGYDYTGQPLNESPLRSMLLDLDKNPIGALVSQDIAQDYELSVGDSLRSYGTEMGNISVFTFTIIGIYQSLTNALPFDTQSAGYYSRAFGQRTVWVNRGYLSQFMNFTMESRNMYAMRVDDHRNTTEVALDLLDAAGYEPPDPSGPISARDYVDVDSEVRAFVETTEYTMDRAVDTMLTVASTLVIFGAIAIYAAEGLSARRREIALMRAMGADKKIIVKTQAAELIVIVGASVLLLLVFAPLFSIITMLAQHTSYMIYPIRVFFSIPYLTLALVLSFFLGVVTLFIIGVSTLAARIQLAQSLNASWSEGGPMGGDV